MKKIISILLSALMISSVAVGTGAVSASAKDCDQGDLVIFEYKVTCSSLIEAFEGSLTYNSDELSIDTNDDISVYDGKTGSLVGNMPVDKEGKSIEGEVRFNGSNSADIYNFKTGSALLTVMFYTKGTSYDPTDFSVQMKNFYNDEDFQNGTNTPYEYSIILNDETVKTGSVDIDADEPTTESTTQVTTEETTESEETTASTDVTEASTTLEPTEETTTVDPSVSTEETEATTVNPTASTTEEIVTTEATESTDTTATVVTEPTEATESTDTTATEVTEATTVNPTASTTEEIVTTEATESTDTTATVVTEATESTDATATVVTDPTESTDTTATVVTDPTESTDTTATVVTDPTESTDTTATVTTEPTSQVTDPTTAPTEPTTACKHQHKATKVTKATYFAKGKSVVTCQDCGKVLSTLTIAKRVLSKPSVKVAAAKKSFKVKLSKKVTGATGIIVSYQLKGKKAVVKKLKNKKATYTIKKLKTNKKYIIKVRAYIKSGKKYAYSKWTAKKTIKIK